MNTNKGIAHFDDNENENEDGPVAPVKNKITQSLAEFLAKYKYAIGPDGKFIPGKANLHYDDLNAADVYWANIGESRNPRDTGVGSRVPRRHEFNSEVNADWIEDTRPGGGWASVKDGVLPIAGMIAAMYGGSALMGAASAAGGGAAAAGTGTAAAGTAAAGTAAGTTAASGLAGSLGMNAGYAASALNAGALNTGMSLVRGKNIGDSLKDGAMGAVLSPVGALAGKASSGLTAGMSGVGKGIAQGAISGAVSGGIGNAVRGKDVWQGIRDGGVNGVVGGAAGAVGRGVSGATGSQLAGDIAKGVVSGRGKINTNTLVNAGLNAAGRTDTVRGIADSLQIDGFDIPGGFKGPIIPGIDAGLARDIVNATTNPVRTPPPRGTRPPLGARPTPTGTRPQIGATATPRPTPTGTRPPIGKRPPRGG